MEKETTDQARRTWPKLSIVLDPELLAEVDRRTADHDPPSRSAAIRALLRVGLNAESDNKPSPRT